MSAAAVSPQPCVRAILRLSANSLPVRTTPRPASCEPTVHPYATCVWFVTPMSAVRRCSCCTPALRMRGHISVMAKATP